MWYCKYSKDDTTKTKTQSSKKQDWVPNHQTPTSSIRQNDEG